jgi:hypothetical protein
MYILKIVREDRPAVIIETVRTGHDATTYLQDVKAEFPGKWNLAEMVQFEQCDKCTKEAGYRISRRDCKHA